MCDRWGKSSLCARFMQKERTVQNDKCGRRKTCEDSPLQAQGPQEDVSVAQGPEPEQVNPIGERGPASEEEDSEDG